MINELKQKSIKTVFKYQLDIYSEIIGFEEEKTININLDYPKYSKMNCTIQSSIDKNNNTYIKCIMDSSK